MGNSYQEMYRILFNKITDVVEELQQVQRQTEELYIREDGPELIVLQKKDDSGPAK
jgi:hypothetical protein